MTGLRAPSSLCSSLTAAIVVAVGVWLSGPDAPGLPVRRQRHQRRRYARRGPRARRHRHVGERRPSDGRQSRAGDDSDQADDRRRQRARELRRDRPLPHRAEGPRRGAAARCRSHPDHDIAAAAHRRQADHRSRADSAWHQRVCPGIFAPALQRHGRRVQPAPAKGSQGQEDRAVPADPGDGVDGRRSRHGATSRTISKRRSSTSSLATRR